MRKATLFLVFVLAACSDSPGGGGTDRPDAAVASVDARTNCLVSPAYGQLGEVTATAGRNGAATTVSITLDAGPPRDTLFLRMTPGTGALSGGLVPGTYPLAGVDINYNQCGLCVNIIADIVPGQGPTKFYMATGGMVTLTSVTPPLVGSVSNLNLAEMELSSGALIPGGCTTSIAAASFRAN